MGATRWYRNVWFWAAAVLAVVAVSVFGYTIYLRQQVDRLARDQLQAGRELLEILDTVRDGDSMAAAWPRLLEYQERGRALKQRAAALPLPRAGLKAELVERYQAEWQQLIKQHARQYERIVQLPGGKEFWEELKSLEQAPVSFTIEESSP